MTQTFIVLITLRIHTCKQNFAVEFAYSEALQLVVPVDVPQRNRDALPVKLLRELRYASLLLQITVVRTVLVCEDPDSRLDIPITSISPLSLGRTALELVRALNANAELSVAGLGLGRGLALGLGLALALASFSAVPLLRPC